MPKIPARYIGEYPIVLAQLLGPYFDGGGKMLTNLEVKSGDTLMMEEHEIRGDTHFFDPGHRDPPLYLGAGHVVKKDGKTADGRAHADLSRPELIALGYQFCEGRKDFQELTSSQPAPGAVVATAASTERAEPEGVV